VAALGTLLRARAARPELVAGDTVKLVLRPEAIEIVRSGGGTLAATVVARTFLGEKIEYVLRCADTTLQAVRYNARPGEIAADGATVLLRVAEDAVTVLPERA
jgi:ABC-type Fe3+/spermidine/putrescine transport system ATPase subunit